MKTHNFSPSKTNVLRKKFFVLIALLAIIANNHAWGQPVCGTTNMGVITPSCGSWSTAAYSAGTLPYWSFTATAGYSYQFSLCPHSGGTEDSYIHISFGGSDVATYDDNGPFSYCYNMEGSGTWTCTTSGTYYITACHYSCSAFTYAGSLRYMYFAAPFNSKGTITPTTTAQTSAYSAGEVAYWSFSATSGTVYNFSFCSSSEDTYIRIYDNTWTQIAMADDNGPWCTGLPASISWTATGTGTYYIVGCHFSCSGFTTASSLSYWYSSTCTTPGTPVSLSGVGASTTTANLSWAAGSPIGSATVTYYWKVYTSGGVLVTSGNTTGTSATASGLSCGTSYYFTVYAYTSCNATQSTAATSGTFSTLACTLGCGNTNLGTITPSGCNPQDVAYSSGTIPYWSFTATAGITYNFSLGANSEDSYLYLYNASLTLVASDDDNGPLFQGLPSSLSYTCTSSGIYYIAAGHYTCTAFTNSSYMTYWSTSSPLGSTTLTTIIPTTSWQNQSYTNGSIYLYNFAATSGVVYDFSLCSNAEDSYIRIYNSTYDLQLSNDDNGPWCSGLPSSISWTAPSTANYIVEISHFGCSGLLNSSYLAYRINLPCVTPANPVATGTTTVACGVPTNISATSTNATAIYWYTGSCGGTLIGTSSPGANFSVSPTATTTYYAMGYNSAGGGCLSAGCGSVTISISTPNPVTATPQILCLGMSTDLNATSAGNTIYWYTVPTGGTPIGTSASGANYTVSPTTTTTYYAEAQSPSIPGGGTNHYICSNIGEPWGKTDMIDAMNAVFGAGNWTHDYFETVNAGTLLTPATASIFIDGSDNNSDEMEAFLTTNITAIENWVNAGGRLVLNAAPNEGNGMSYGFGGTQLIYDIATPYLTTTGNTANPTHPIFNGPYTPAGTSWTATYISHGYITGTGLTTLLTATNGTNTWNVLCEKTWGLGRVLFGGITFHSYWTVTAQALNLRENMIYYISNHASPGCVSGRAPITVTVPVMTTISPTTGASGTCNIMSPNSWVYILDPANKLITGVFDATGGNNLMSTTAYLTIDPTVQIHPYTGEPYLQRHVQITPTSSGIADVKLYFTQAEFLALQAAVPAITSINDLVVTKFDDAGVWANAVYFPTPVVTANDPWPGVHSLKISVTGFSRFYIHARFLGGPLPVNLLSFTGTCQDSKVTLNWSTASEINNDYFTVERTKTGEQWEFIATVEGAGNSNQVRNYEAVDNNPMNGVSYYRLSQTDFNGTVKSFGPAEVSCSSTGSEVSVYPNPFKDELVINYRNMTGPKADVKIMDILGNIVMDRSFDLQPSGSDSFMLNLGDLATGLYYIQFKSGDYSYHTRVVKD